MIAGVWRPLVALGFGLVLALGADQTIPRLLPPPPHQDQHWYLRTVQYHPLLGWSGYPNFVGTRDGRPVRTNSLGYRDREPAAAAGGRALRVLFLGDSFTWGDEVALDERFTSLLETSCAPICDRVPVIQSVNRGIIGYGTAQSFLDYLLVRDPHPFDLVVLALFTGNDLTDNSVVDSSSGPRPRLIRCDRPASRDGLCLEGVPVPPVVDWPEHRWISPRGSISRAFGWSGTVAMASERRAPGFLIAKRVARQMDRVSKDLPFPIVERTSTAAIADPIDQLEAILRAMDRTIRAEGKAFGVLVFPNARVYAGDPRRELRDYDQVVGVLGRLNIPFADYYEATKSFRLEDLYSGSDGHWRPSGHQEAAKLLRGLIVTLLDEKRTEHESRSPQ
jgi:hypothetical protein